jgi:hypothetical protein
LCLRIVDQWRRDIDVLDHSWKRFRESLLTVLKIAFYIGQLDEGTRAGDDAIWIAEALGVDSDWLRGEVLSRIPPELAACFRSRQSGHKALLAIDGMHDSLTMLGNLVREMPDAG